MYSLNSAGCPLQSSSRDVSIFFFFIALYFSVLERPGRPYQGRLPRRKYNSTCPIVSKSSLLDYSIYINKIISILWLPIPLCVLTLAYLAVPVKFLPSLYGICSPSLFLKHLANPKSIMNILSLVYSVPPIKKLSGLISLCMILSSCTFSILLIICIATMRTVFKSNCRLHEAKMSSRDGPNISITITWNCLVSPWDVSVPT